MFFCYYQKQRKTRLDISKSFFYTLITFIIFFSTSCFEENTNPFLSENPQVFSFSKDTICWKEELTIYGKELGLLPEDGEVIFEDGSALKVSDCSRWNHSSISFIVPIDTKSGYIYIKYNGKISNKLYLKIIDLSFIEAVPVPAGEFQMGSLYGLKNELPLHSVLLTKGLFVAKYEVSQFLYEYIMSENPSIRKSDFLPVHNIKWLDAIKFCNALSKRLLLDSCYEIKGDVVEFDYSANGFRLPTEAEWEYCCKAGKNGDFGGTGDLDEMGWYNKNSGFLVQPSGKKLPNDFGICDMHGNVSECCWDWYQEKYYADSPAADPTGPEAGGRRVVRGGSVADGNDFARSSSRNFDEARAKYVGIRLVRNRE
ncbi:MAG: formylglycine-generating enzyme family protein [Ignavibacteria bacterium]|nr:formylglycine-generating enzyme family protein [Ignavibacteria bacterium]